MDVTCERCSTEYEFDDALVSGRGTTVKCTNCGHQFKVRRPEGTATSERWLVRTVDGRELEYHALRELQAAITNANITKEDVLSRDQSRPRRLGSIAELEPFFAGAANPLIPSTAPGLGSPRARIPTPAGLGVLPAGTATYRNEGSVAIPLPIAPRRPTLDGGFERGEAAESEAKPPLAPRRPAAFQTAPPVNTSPIAVPTPRHGPSWDAPERAAQLPGVVVAPGDAPPVPGGHAVYARTEASARDLDFGATRPSAQPNTPIFAGAAADLGRNIPDDAPTQRRAVPIGGEPPRLRSGEDEPPMASGRRQLPSNPDVRAYPGTPTPTDVRASYIHDDHGPATEPRFSSLTPSKQLGRARWIVGVVVLGMLAFGLIVVRRGLSAGRPAAGSAAPDERVSKLLTDGEKALQDGDLEIAKEQIDKASALAENDPRVVMQQARLAILRAEVPWLRVRLSQSDAGPGDDPAAKKELDLAAERARKAAGHAAELAPTDPGVIRYRIDALRISGDTAGARKLVGGLGVSSSQPESAVVLAALDLSEDKPDWHTVIERLRVAAGGEQNLGRARSLLVYALVRSGAPADAKTELDRLASLPRPHPLVSPLRAFVDKASGKTIDALPNASGRDARPPGETSGSAKPSEPKVSSNQPDTSRPKDKPDKPSGKGPRRTEDGRVPDDYVFPGSGADTSDLPGHATPPKPTAEPAPKPPTDAPDPPGGKP